MFGPFVPGCYEARHPNPIHRYVYAIGVIDILIEYGALKSAETVTKSIVHFGHRGGISCVAPHSYADRFLAFMRSAIK